MINPYPKKLYYNKFKQIVDSNFHLFLYLSVSKADFDNEHTQNLYDLDLGRFTLPSAFRVVKKQKVQASQISMAYSSYKCFMHLKNMYNLNAFSFKQKEKWYAYALLEDLKPYKEPLSLCASTHQSFFDKTVNFAKLKSTHQFKRLIGTSNPYDIKMLLLKIDRILTEFNENSENLAQTQYLDQASLFLFEIGKTTREILTILNENSNDLNLEDLNQIIVYLDNSIKFQGELAKLVYVDSYTSASSFIDYIMDYFNVCVYYLGLTTLSLILTGFILCLLKKYIKN